LTVQTQSLGSPEEALVVRSSFPSQPWGATRGAIHAQATV
jgi:hypothetical protein